MGPELEEQQLERLKSYLPRPVAGVSRAETDTKGFGAAGSKGPMDFLAIPSPNP